MNKDPSIIMSPLQRCPKTGRLQINIFWEYPHISRFYPPNSDKLHFQELAHEVFPLIREDAIANLNRIQRGLEIFQETPEENDFLPPGFLAELSI